ncbi:sugar phosphate isomerase/epimerase family protein [Nibricoccus sp. IMCC34717]|uniref:sugar phosphate isomerase/epimerase family protein n=1 Tax=Nibricoccus sp. IMCC34717 TaxID=3034021 RepID=UPI00384DCA81
MLTPGLVSVTFRQLSIEQIATLAGEASLGAIEWAGDVHVTPGDLNAAKAAAHLSREHGLRCASYGSYFRAGESGQHFEPVLETCLAIGAPCIRVWAGAESSAIASPEKRALVIEALQQACDSAARAGLVVALEFHDNTLADSPAATLALIHAVARTNLRTHWQPPHGVDATLASAGLTQLSPHLAHIHVFHWWPDPGHRRPLEEGRGRWRTFLRTLRQTAPGPRDLLLEFVPGDDPSVLKREADCLRALLDPNECSFPVS